MEGSQSQRDKSCLKNSWLPIPWPNHSSKRQTTKDRNKSMSTLSGSHLLRSQQTRQYKRMLIHILQEKWEQLKHKHMISLIILNQQLFMTSWNTHPSIRRLKNYTTKKKNKWLLILFRKIKMHNIMIPWSDKVQLRIRLIHSAFWSPRIQLVDSTTLAK